MRVFLTGGTGFTGAYLVRELVEAGHELTLLVRESAPRENSVVGTLGDVGAWRAAMRGHDVLIHHAVWWDDVEGERGLNDLAASIRIFEAAAEEGVPHIVYTSSTGVHRPFRAQMYEDMPLRPADDYGATKASAELWLHATAALATVIRPGPVVGVPLELGGRFRPFRPIQQIVECARRGEPVEVVRGSARQFIGASDLAKVYRAAIERVGPSATYVAVAKEPTSWEAIARHAVRATKSTSEIVLRHPQPNDPVPRPVFDVTRMQNDLGLSFDADAAVFDHVSYIAQRE